MGVDLVFSVEDLLYLSRCSEQYWQFECQYVKPLLDVLVAVYPCHGEVYLVFVPGVVHVCYELLLYHPVPPVGVIDLFAALWAGDALRSASLSWEFCRV